MTRNCAVMLGVLCAGCVGTAGGDLFEFSAYGAGPRDAVNGSPYAFQTGRGYAVTLSRAKLHVGALYLNRSVPTSVASDTSCFLPGIYVAEVTSGLDLDVLSPDLALFPALGAAIGDRARAGEVWLVGRDVNEQSDPTVILDVAGIAEKDGAFLPFEASITIGTNRVVVPSDPALPGGKPICKQRIVTPIPVDLTPARAGQLVLRVDPRGWFANVEFSSLEQVSTAPPLYRFHDSSDDQPSTSLYAGLRSSIGPYTLSWESARE